MCERHSLTMESKKEGVQEHDKMPFFSFHAKNLALP